MYSVRFQTSLGLPFSEKKIILGNTNRWKFSFVLAEFRLFRGAENARNSVPSNSTEEKAKKARNYAASHFEQEKTTRIFVISFQTLPQKIKILGIPFQTI
jgi:hypothetical protein